MLDPSFTIGAYNEFSPSNPLTHCCMAASPTAGPQFPHDFDAPKEWMGVRDLVPDSRGVFRVSNWDGCNFFAEFDIPKKLGNC